MDGIHPKFVLSKRFPVHAAIEQLNLHALKVSQKFYKTVLMFFVDCDICKHICKHWERKMVYIVVCIIRTDHRHKFGEM